jgi:hypothetical protein
MVQNMKNYPFCKDCNKRLGDYLSIRCKSCTAKIRKWSQKTKNKISKANKGKNNGMFGHPPIKINEGKWNKYNKIWMRSLWESSFAKWCDKNKIKWLYEPYRFNLGDYTYSPDFYLPEFDTYIEIKGYWKLPSKKKFILFKKQFPKIKILVFMRKELKSLGVL